MKVLPVDPQLEEHIKQHIEDTEFWRMKLKEIMLAPWINKT